MRVSEIPVKQICINQGLGVHKTRIIAQRNHAIGNCIMQGLVVLNL